MTFRLVLAYLGTAVTFVVLDFLWLAVIAKGFYQGQVGGLMASPPNFVAAGLLYLLYSAGLVGFVVLPALGAGSLGQAALVGALLGLVVYGVYDLTNLAVLKGWTVPVAVVDMLWGAVVSAASASGGYALARLAGGAG